MPTTLHIALYESGRKQAPGHYSGPELEALITAIEDLWSPTYHSTRTFRVEVDDDNELYLAYIDDRTDKALPIPLDWMTKTIRFGLKKDLALVGDRLPIHSSTLHVQFTDE